METPSSTELGEIHLSAVMSRNNPGAVLDITMIMSAIMAIFTACRERNNSTSATVQGVRTLAVSRKKRILKHRLIREHGGRKEWKEAGGWQLVDDALEALDTTSDEILTGMINESLEDDEIIESGVAVPATD